MNLELRPTASCIGFSSHLLYALCFYDMMTTHGGRCLSISRLQRRRWRTHLVFTTVYYGGNGVFGLLREIGMGWDHGWDWLVAWVHSEIDLSVDFSPFKMTLKVLFLCLSSSTESVCRRWKDVRWWLLRLTSVKVSLSFSSTCCASLDAREFWHTQSIFSFFFRACQQVPISHTDFYCRHHVTPTDYFASFGAPAQSCM